MYINFSPEVANVYEVYDLYFALPPCALQTMSGKRLFHFDINIFLLIWGNAIYRTAIDSIGPRFS